tara:strand:+ start:192 stop:488 length:297 start_codon:yes stop_codon:yes gene_type:complete
MELTKSLTQPKVIKSLLAILLGSIALTISAKIKIPFYPVPMTMQTFVVLFLGISLGYKVGLATIGLYLLEGIVGLPVFLILQKKVLDFYILLVQLWGI